MSTADLSEGGIIPVEMQRCFVKKFSGLQDNHGKQSVRPRNDSEQEYQKKVQVEEP